MSKHIAVRGGLTALVDDADFPELSKKRWHLWGGPQGITYAATARWVAGKCIQTRMHNLLLPAPPGFVVDHVNGDTLDNRRCNLRVCTHAQNLWNRHAPPRGVSRFMGVCRDRNGWRARISCVNHRISMGVFAREVDAALAYDAKCRELRGEFARPNFTAVVPRSRLRQLLLGTGGHFFSVCFIKRTDGSERVMHCRTGVSPRPGPSIIKITESHDLFSVWDVDRREFRYIPLEGVEWIAFKKTFVRPAPRRPRQALDVTTQELLFAQTAG